MSKSWVSRRASRAAFAENARFYKGFERKGLIFPPARCARRDGSRSGRKVFFSKWLSKVFPNQSDRLSIVNFLIMSSTIITRRDHFETKSLAVRKSEKPTFVKANFISIHTVYWADPSRCVAMRRETRARVAMRRNASQSVAMRRDASQCVAMRRDASRCVAMRRGTVEGRGASGNIAEFQYNYPS